MPDTVLAALQTEGLIWLLVAVCVAGLVRGFAGFGSGMIIMPAASSVLSPVDALIFMTAAELLGPLPNLRAAWRVSVRRDVALLVLGVLLGLPAGLWALSHVSPAVFGWTVSVVVLFLLALMVTGWRYRGVLTRRLTVGAGLTGGFLTGIAGIAGPPVIMLYMASRLPIAIIRANFLLYLLAVDALLFALLWSAGAMNWAIVALGLIFGLPNILANYLGGLLFNPGAERVFRVVAYIVIGISAIVGLPLWKG